jgi:hypothetical protein
MLCLRHNCATERPIPEEPPVIRARAEGRNTDAIVGWYRI